LEFVVAGSVMSGASKDAFERRVLGDLSKLTTDKALIKTATRGILREPARLNDAFTWLVQECDKVMGKMHQMVFTRHQNVLRPVLVKIHVAIIHGMTNIVFFR